MLKPKLKLVSPHHRRRCPCFQPTRPLSGWWSALRTSPEWTTRSSFSRTCWTRSTSATRPGTSHSRSRTATTSTASFRPTHLRQVRISNTRMSGSWQFVNYCLSFVVTRRLFKLWHCPAESLIGYAFHIHGKQWRQEGIHISKSFCGWKTLTSAWPSDPVILRHSHACLTGFGPFGLHHRAPTGSLVLWRIWQQLL